MGNQTNNINKVELRHREAKNVVNKGFLEAFVFSQGSDRLNSAELMRSQNLSLRKDNKDSTHRSKALKAIKKGRAHVN
jgi:hypothetical protein